MAVRPMTLDLDDEIMDFAKSPVMPIPTIDVSDDAASDVSERPKYNLQTYLAERQLIRLVSKQPALYNCEHRCFTNGAHKEKLWQKIAKKLSLEITMCKSTWAHLRYKYQRHVQRLRKYRRKTQASHMYKRPRPTILYEDDMLFLYTHVSRFPPLLRERTSVTNNVLTSVDDDVTIVPTPPAEIIVVDEVDEDYQYKITPDQKLLIDAVRAYPLLYDPLHPNYNNFFHRGLIWSAISNELREKATRLMKNWLQLVTRYEWESIHINNNKSPVMQHLSFLAPHIHKTPFTVYKLSLYLHKDWADHINHFRSVMNLINMLKMLPELVQMVDNNHDKDHKPQRYHGLWLRVSAQLNLDHQRCEVTWLILRNFNMELTEMRKVGYQLKDKWFFEKIISCLYRVLHNRKTRRAKKRAVQKNCDSAPPVKQAPIGNSNSPLMPQPPPLSLPLAIVYPPCVNSGNRCPIPIANGDTSSVINTTINTTSPTTSPTTTTNAIKTVSNVPIRHISVASTPVMPATPPIISSTRKPPLKKILPKPPLPEPALVQLADTTGNAQPKTLHNSQLIQPGSIIGPLAPGSLGDQLGTDTTIQPMPPLPVSIATSNSTAPTMPDSELQDLGCAPNGSEVPQVLLPNPMCVPLTVRNDKVTLPPVCTKSRSKPPLSTFTSTSTSILESALPSPAIRDEMPNKTSTKITLQSNANAMAMAKAISTLPRNDIKVEFIESKETGRILFVTGKDMPGFEMTMSLVGKLIREVMAIPQLHCCDSKLTNRCNQIWTLLAKKLHFPQNVLRSIWAFLSNNINLFPKIAPIAELMRPFKTTIKVWKKSYRIFGKFDEIARKYQLMYHKDSLPALMQLFEKYEHLYWDLRRPAILPPQHLTEAGSQEVWRVANELFPHINHQEVWSMFKSAFTTYMEDLEYGIENPWPQNWWHTLAKLQFLINVRYHPLEPYYHIVHNKFMEEVQRCSMCETLMQPISTGSVVQKESVTTTILVMPSDLPEETTLLNGTINMLHQNQNEQQLIESVLIESVPSMVQPNEMPNQNHKHQQESVPCASVDLAKTVAIDETINRDEMPTVNELACQSYGRYLPNIDAYQLSRLLRCNPNIIGMATGTQKDEAWLNVAKLMNATVNDCRLSLQHALRELRILKITDPFGQCSMSHKYYRHMRCIYIQDREGNHNLSERLVMEPIERVFPERYLPEINMITCKPSLVVKNWAYAIGNLQNQDTFKLRIKQIFMKYAPAPGSIE